MRCAQAHDYEGFFEETILERREALYPPFCTLVNAVYFGTDRGAVIQASGEGAERLRDLPRCKVLGPADCPIERLQGFWRRHLLIKLPPKSNAGPIAERLRPDLPSSVQLTLDVDPYVLL